MQESDSPEDLLTAIVDAYNLRGGGVETANKGSKQGLGLASRNNRRFVAQEVLVLLSQLACNLTMWVRNMLAKCLPAFQYFGMLRIVRDVFHLPGKIQINMQGQILSIQLNQDHDLAPLFLQAFRSFMSSNDLYFILSKIQASGLAVFSEIPPREGKIPARRFKNSEVKVPGVREIMWERRTPENRGGGGNRARWHRGKHNARSAHCC